MGNNTFNNTFNKEASVAQGDNATANQYINASNNEEFNEKLDAMFEKLNESQANEMEKLTDELFKLIDERLVKTNKLSEEQVEKVEILKLSSDLKAKIKFGLPMNFFISQLTGVTVEVEKEWKLSEEIEAESVISTLRKLLKHKELQITRFNELE